MNIRQKRHIQKFFEQEEYIKKQYYIIFISIAVHLIFFIANLFIGGYHCDEAMTILNARSLADGGTDIMGEKLPVYFDTWLYGGQSPIATYIVAFFIKIFGANYFSYRFPILLFGIIGLFAFRSFLNEVFIKAAKEVTVKNYNYVFIILALASFSPWHIYTSTYMLDCDFFPHFLVIGMMFLAKAVNSYSNKKFYVLSMIFFALCFYCYIASVLIIPVFLVLFFIILLIKKKIPISCVITSFLTILAVSAPFILFGLVNIGIIKPFTFLGFSFSDMPLYNRANSITVLNNHGIISKVKEIWKNFYLSLLILGIPDLTFFEAEVMFGYTNFIGGIIAFCGVLITAVSVIRKKVLGSKLLTVFSVCGLGAIICFCVLSNSGDISVAYRFGTLFYFLIMFEGIGFVEIFSKIKKLNIKKCFCIFMAISFTIFTFEYVFSYSKKTDTDTSVFGDSLYKSISFIEDNCASDNYTVCIRKRYGAGGRNERQTVFLRNYYYDKKSFDNFSDVLKTTGLVASQNDWIESVPQLTQDNSIKYHDIYGDPKIYDDYNIIYTDWIQKIDFDSTIYTIKEFGIWSVIYRK